MITIGKLGSSLIMVLTLLTISEGRHVWESNDTGRFCMIQPTLGKIMNNCLNTSSVNELTQPLTFQNGLSAVNLDAALQSFCSEFETVESCCEAETSMCTDRESILADIREKNNICDPVTRDRIHAHLASQGSDVIFKGSCFDPVVQYLIGCTNNIIYHSELRMLFKDPNNTRIVQLIEVIQRIRDSVHDCLSVLNPAEDLEDPECRRLTRGNYLLFFAISSAVMGPPGMALNFIQLLDVTFMQIVQDVQNSMGLLRLG